MTMDKDNSNDIVRISLKEVVGNGYGRFWHWRGRYRVAKGGRASKKSTTTALWLICKIMEYPLANALVIRRYFKDHRDSTFAQLKWAAHRLKVSHLWEFKVSPLEARFIPTGQKILFRGLDDPSKITSITVEQGFLCWTWWEEAYQVENEHHFDMVDGSIRGEMPEGYFKQHTLTFNPWSERTWLKRRFFDSPDKTTLAITTTFRQNEFLGPDDIAYYSSLSPRRMRIEGDGEWGIAEGLIYDNWDVREFKLADIRQRAGALSGFGLDFGYTLDPTGFSALAIIPADHEIYVFDEIYQRGMSNRKIAETIRYKGYAKESIVADSAEPKSIDELKSLGLNRIKPCTKGKDSVMHGIQLLQDYRIIVHPSCKNHAIELGNYCHRQDKTGQWMNEPIGDFNHLMDAMRYAVTDRVKSGRSSKSPHFAIIGSMKNYGKWR